MRKLLLLILAVLMTISFTETMAEAAVPEARAPYAVQISPNMGLLKVREQVKLTSIGPDLYSFVIYIPASTSIQTGFNAWVKGFTLNSVSSKTLLPEDDPAGSPRAELIKKLKAARQERSRLDGMSQALNTRLRLWTSQAEKSDNSPIAQAQDLEKIDQAMGTSIPNIYAQLAELPEQLQKADQLINYLQNELNSLGGERPQLAEITITVAGSASNTNQTATAEYSYFSYNCDWQPSYSFEADPLKGSIVFKQQANIRQNSGRDWNNVEVTLSTKALDFKLLPSNLRPWNLYRQQPESSSRASKSMVDAEMSVDEVLYDAVPAAMAPAAFQRQAPVSLELGTHREWQVGQVNLSSKNPTSLELERQDWKGDFYYTLRPSVEEASYLTAKVELEKAIELARGEAIFIVDGRMAGYLDNFTSGGKEVEIFFGKDDMITVESQDIVSMTGQERFITKTNTYNWHWKFKVLNKRNRAVKVKVEDPLPQVRDASIKLKMESTPIPKEDYRSYHWETTVPASGEFVIEHKVEARASGSERIIPGR